MRGLALAVSMSAGCTWHLDRNAPGHIDPRRPPNSNVAFEPPRDPGEIITNVTAGGHIGAGVGFGGPGWDGAGLAAEGGFEIGLHWGEVDQSHVKPDLLPLPHGWTETAIGVNAGVNIVSHDGEESELGTVFVEVQRRVLLVGGYAVGYGLDPGDGAHGPHVTAFFSGLYVRAGYQFDRGAALVFGMVIKLPVMTFVESR